jgi:hypothetical protein
MPSNGSASFPVICPDTQIAFAARLREVRGLYLREALQETVAGLSIAELDAELGRLVPAEPLRLVASFGLRGEVVFPVPLVLRQNPHLLGYYRLLYGISAKGFYKRPHFAGFGPMEDDGRVPARADGCLEAACRSLIATASLLVAELPGLSGTQLHELQLLTLGQQLKGGVLNRVGQAAVRGVHALLLSIAGRSVTASDGSTITLLNASRRTVRLDFADDPDVRVVEVLPSGEERLLAIEIKGGVDSSNVYNRLGEAEKSHQKARQAGYHECWTLVRADFRLERARLDSPSTNQFFRLDQIMDQSTEEHRRFSDQLCSRLGIRDPKAR